MGWGVALPPSPRGSETIKAAAITRIGIAAFCARMGRRLQRRTVEETPDECVQAAAAPAMLDANPDQPAAEQPAAEQPAAAKVAIHRRSRRRAPYARARTAAAFAALALAAAAGAATAWIVSLGPPPLGKELEFSTTVVDREGRLLRAYATSDGRWRLPERVEGVDPRFIALLTAYEDRRFREHAGVDPRALLRAGVQILANGRILSGGSTLTMQVARLLEPRAERSLAAKLRQIVRAVEIERHLDKEGVLALYLSLAPYGGNLEGIRAASLAYFGKEPKRLTLAEAALLVALPQSPQARRPDRAAGVAQRARNRVLDRVARTGLFAPAEIDRAKAEAVPSERKPMPALAPLAADDAVAAMPKRSVVRLTIDAAWQASLEDLARERARNLGPNVSVAILAVDNATGEVLARVGSPDYFDEQRAGQVDMSKAWRSPGSTLKPFIYGLGFEDGIIHPETLIEDRPVRYGTYAPENFDLTFQGTVPVRKALQLSLNIPAVAVLDKIGAGRFAARLHQAGGALVLPSGEAPGLAMGLGGVGVRLADLVMLYAGLARLGTTVPLIERPDESMPAANAAMAQAAAARRLMEPVAAWYVGNVLLGTPPPENAPARRIAFKTGTSYGYRDAWSVGFDGKRTVGVWVGRPDGAPVPGLAGRTAAAPILFDAFARSGKVIAPLPKAPHGALVTTNAKLPRTLQRFHQGWFNTAADVPLRIMFPPDGARLELATDERGGLDPVALKISGGAAPLTVLANGNPVGSAGPKRTVFFTPDGPGFVRLTVIDAKGATDSVMVRLQ
jgi:penicillin-binding protein 1C